MIIHQLVATAPAEEHYANYSQKRNHTQTVVRQRTLCEKRRFLLRCGD